MFISVWAHWKIESSYSPRKQKSHNLIQKAHSQFMLRLLSRSQWIQVLLFIILSVCILSAWDWLRFFSFHGVTTMIWLNLFCSIQSVQLILLMIISLILEQESNQTNKRWVRKHRLAQVIEHQTACKKSKVWALNQHNTQSFKIIEGSVLLYSVRPVSCIFSVPVFKEY